MTVWVQGVLNDLAAERMGLDMIRCVVWFVVCVLWCVH